MRKLLSATMAIVVVAIASMMATGSTRFADLTGTWIFSVDLDTGGHGDPTFVLAQNKEVLTGSYDGPLGQRKVTGTVKESTAVFGFDFTDDSGVTHKVTYTGTIESPTKMSGTIAISDGPSGKWTANKK